MSRKSNVEVSIGGKVYTLSGYEGAEYLQKVASYLNRKISEIHAAEDYRRLSPEMKAMLLQLNIADDYFQIERLQKESERKDREIYDLKHNLVTSQLESEKNKKELEELEETNRKLNEDKEELTELLDEALAEEADEEKPSEKSEKNE